MSDLMLPEEIRAEFTVNADGSTTTSIRGAARLIGVPHNSLLYQLNGGRKQPSKLYQKLTEHGFEPGQFSQGLSEIALTLII